MISEARPAATICVFRPGAGGDEVLMVQRTTRASFMGGAWVFPGGGIDRDDRATAAAEGEWTHGDEDREVTAAKVAALRELQEETGITIAQDDDRVDLGALVYFARWITPTAVPLRFDTHFFATEVAPGTTAEPDRTEIDDVAWIPPAEALRRSTEAGWVVPFPTRMTLRFLARFSGLDELRSHLVAQGGVQPVQPRIRIGADGRPEVLLPGDPGFEDAGDLPPPSDEVLRRIALAGSPDDAIPELGP